MSVQPWEPSIARLEGAYGQVADRLNGIDRSLDSIRGEIGSLHGEIGSLRKDMNAGQWRTIAFMATSWITLLLAIFFKH